MSFRVFALAAALALPVLPALADDFFMLKDLGVTSATETDGAVVCIRSDDIDLASDRQGVYGGQWEIRPFPSLSQAADGVASGECDMIYLPVLGQDDYTVLLSKFGTYDQSTALFGGTYRWIHHPN